MRPSRPPTRLRPPNLMLPLPRGSGVGQAVEEEAGAEPGEAVSVEMGEVEATGEMGEVEEAGEAGEDR